tara:strand:- start:1077 stop:1535 length:459 start_codon:yes stop_codon:yes gene_type:complete
MQKNELYMQKALLQARYALAEDEVPVGAVIVYKDRIIAKSYNQVEKLKDPTAHAEMLAITQASSYLGSKWLHECTLYVTLEPCIMCAGALILSRIEKIVFGASDPKAGAFGSLTDVNKLKLNHKIGVKESILEKDCSLVLKKFFKAKRKIKT